MFTRIAIAAMLTVSVSAHPGGLECGTDDTTRLTLGAKVMNGPVVEGDTSDLSKFSAKFAKHKNTTTVHIAAPDNLFFAVRVPDGLTITVGKKEAGLLNMTAKCTNQVFSVPPINSTKKEIKYSFEVQHTTGHEIIHLGYSSTGPPGIKLLSIGSGPVPPPSPPPSPPAPPASPCAATEFCCPDAKACLTPTGVSCSKDAKACSKDQICCPFTKECVTASHPCTPVATCKATEFCCPDAKHCLTPVAPGTMCDPTNKSACPSPQVCCPLIKQCVSVGDACVASAPAFMEM